MLGTGNEKVSFTSMRDVGRLLVSALKTPPGSVEERILRVNSFTTSPLEVVGEFEKQTGGKWDVSYTSLEDVRRAEKEAWEQERPSATLFTLRRIWAEGGTLYDERDNGRIGVPDGELDTLESQVRKVIASVG